jgi:hypothetical protein
MKELVELIAKALVDNPDDVQVLAKPGYRPKNYSNYGSELPHSFDMRDDQVLARVLDGLTGILDVWTERTPMLPQLRKFKVGRIGVLFVSYFIVNLMTAPLRAQTTVLGELTFKGASKVEKTSGVWIDGKYVGYLGELWGHKRIMLIPGDHELTVRQAGYEDFTETLTVEPKELLLVPVKMKKASQDTWPTVTAELKINVGPDRAAVFVDDRFLGHAGELGGAFHSMLISPGMHRIKVTLPGYQTFEQEVTLVARQKSVIRADLAKGSIHQADVLIDEATNSTREK